MDAISWRHALQSWYNEEWNGRLLGCSLSPVAINKFTHTVFSAWIVRQRFLCWSSAWFIFMKREKKMAMNSIKIAAIFGFMGTFLTALTGDGSAYQVAQKQPMKLAAMERSLWRKRLRLDLLHSGWLDPSKKSWDRWNWSFCFSNLKFGSAIFLSNRDTKSFVEHKWLNERWLWDYR